MTLILHGFPFSNYYNIVKHVLTHKQLEFTEDHTYGGGEGWLSISPLGKVPALTTEQGEHLSESSVICDYLEETYPEYPLYPADSFQRGRVRQIMKVSELYLELPCRRLIPFSFSGATPSDELKADIRNTLERGIGAMNRLCEFDPFLLGKELTMADFYVRYVNAVVKMAGSPTLEWDILAEMPGMPDWDARMAESTVAIKIDADQAADAEPFFAYLKERSGT